MAARRRKAAKHHPTTSDRQPATVPPVGVPRASQPKQRARPLMFTAIGALAALIVIGVLAGWLRLRDDGGDSANDGPQPIAVLDTPDVHSLLINVNNPDHLLFGSHAGLKESQDGGFTWADGTLQGKDAMSMARSLQSPMTIYVTGHDVVEVSRDNGASWQPLEHDLPGTDVHAFAQDSDSPELLYAFVVGYGVFRSENGGVNWVALTKPPPGGTPFALAAAADRVYVATEAGIRISFDRGETWQPLSAQPSGTTLTLALSPTDPGLLYAGTADGLARSTDSGATWIALGPAGIPVLALAVSPTDPQRVTFVTQGGGVYRSDDGGTTWRAPA